MKFKKEKNTFSFFSINEFNYWDIRRNGHCEIGDLYELLWSLVVYLGICSRGVISLGTFSPPKMKGKLTYIRSPEILYLIVFAGLGFRV